MSVPSDLRNSDLLSSLLPAGAEADAWHPSSGRVRARGRARGLGGAGPGSWSIDSCASAVSAVSSTLSEEAEDEAEAVAERAEARRLHRCEHAELPRDLSARLLYGGLRAPPKLVRRRWISEMVPHVREHGLDHFWKHGSRGSIVKVHVHCVVYLFGYSLQK